MIEVACAEFVRWSLSEGCDGLAALEKAIELGLVREVSFDPVKHACDAAEECDVQAGDSWYVLVDDILKLLPPAPCGSSGH